jgi:KDO2-lipid IV(A) lauroyltransferase
MSSALPPTNRASSSIPPVEGTRRRRSVASRQRRDALGHLLFRAITPVFTHLSWERCQRVGPRIGDLGWRISRRDRERALDHLAIAFPELAPAARRELARASFRHFGTVLAECLHLRDADCTLVDRVTSAEGWEHVLAAREARRPILILTGHCGNWELLAAWLNCKGLGMAVVARALEDAFLDRALVGLRARFGTETIARGSMTAARRLLAVLRGGGALGMLIDQDTKVEGVWVPFFGRPAYTPVGAAQIALRQQALVLPTFIERLGPDDPQSGGLAGRHHIAIHPPLALPPDPVAATAAMTERIEAQVRRRPEQWVWMHRRWRRQPPPAPGPGGNSPAPAGAG